MLDICVCYHISNIEILVSITNDIFTRNKKIEYITLGLKWNFSFDWCMTLLSIINSYNTTVHWTFITKKLSKTAVKSDGLCRFYGQNRLTNGAVMFVAFWLDAFQKATDNVVKKWRTAMRFDYFSKEKRHSLSLLLYFYLFIFNKRSSPSLFWKLIF